MFLNICSFNNQCNTLKFNKKDKYYIFKLKFKKIVYQ